MPKILVAEDNPADVYLIRIALAEHGIEYPLQVAADGREALEIIHEHAMLDESQLNLIILDLNLPVHDGIEILKRLRESERLADVPVVVLTSSDSPRDRIVASEFGAARFLRKPSSLEHFLGLGAIFKEALGQGGPAEAVTRLREAVLREPANVDAHVELGRTLYETGAWEAALKETERALAMNPNHVGALYNLGIIHADFGDTERARSCWERAIGSDPESESGKKAGEGLARLRREDRRSQ
jgi:CheY-like chemotaxis protein